MRKKINYPGIKIWLPYFLGILAAGLYLIQSIYYSYTNDFVLDEGAYSYKGYLFITGEFAPYQEYGPWTNHMPLSFLIPGMVQVIFGPGIRVARCYSVATSLLILLGLWVVSTRLGGKWGGALTMLAMAINAYQIAIYSTANSQVLVACLLVWSLAFVLGEQRKTWEIVLGSGLAGLLAVTRINMAPVLLFVLFYVFWQYGKKRGLVATITGVSVVALTLVSYWPNILYFLVNWLPQSITPMFDPWRLQDAGTPIWDPQLSLESRINSFLEGLSIHYLAIFGLLGFGGLALRREFWKKEWLRRITISLSMLLAFLLAIHAWAALGNNYCVYCFSPYLTNFTSLGLIIIVTTVNGTSLFKSRTFSIYAASLGLLLSLALSYYHYRIIGSLLLGLPVPRFNRGQLLPGSAPLQAIFENFLKLDLVVSRKLLALLGGLFWWILAIVLAWFLTNYLLKRKSVNISMGMVTSFILMVAWYIPLMLILKIYPISGEVCNSDQIRSYEKVGTVLARTIPAGTTVYWRGSLSVVSLLEVPELHIFPPQINNGYSYRVGGDPDGLLRRGMWNDALDARWRNEAEFVVIEERRLNEAWEGYLESGGFELIESTLPANPCRPDSVQHIYRREAGQPAVIRPDEP